MRTKPVYIASDVHLGAAPQAQEEAFLTWLAGTADACSLLVLNGDLFDFWFEFRWGVPQGHERILGLLRQLVDSGLPVTLMGGNHDWWGGRYLRDEIGLEFLQDPVVRDYAGFRTYLAHGDGLGEGDFGYRALKLVLRGRLTRFPSDSCRPVWGAASRSTYRRQSTESTAPRTRKKGGPGLSRSGPWPSSSRNRNSIWSSWDTRTFPVCVRSGPGDGT